MIVAAGSSSRMGGQNKLLAPLGESTVAAHSIAAFESFPEVSDIVVVTREEDIPDYLRIAAGLGWRHCRRNAVILPSTMGPGRW